MRYLLDLFDDRVPIVIERSPIEVMYPMSSNTFMSFPKQLTVKDIETTIREKANIPDDVEIVVLMGEQRVYRQT